MPVTVYPGREAWLDGVCASWLGGRLGPQIRDDAIRFAPLGPSWGYTPRHPRVPARAGGGLKASIEDHLDGPRHLIIEAHAPYAAYVELGTSPHVIASHGNWPLWSPLTGYFGHPPEGDPDAPPWTWARRVVHHPGSRPEPYLRPALWMAR